MERFKLAVALVRQAGAALRQARLEADAVRCKTGHQDLVTVWDKKTEQFLRQGILNEFPADAIVGEEFPAAGDASPETVWYIDPIDGTTNFIRGYQPSAISVGLVKDGQGVMGLVLDLGTGELFTAVRGGGAFCNGNPLQGAQAPLENAVIVFGTAPYYRELADATFAAAKELFLCCGDLRRSGSAALDLCHVAAGQCDGFFEARLSPWDYAAASVILREAGCPLDTLPGQAFSYEKPQAILAGSPAVYPALREIVGRCLG